MFWSIVGELKWAKLMLSSPSGATVVDDQKCQFWSGSGYEYGENRANDVLPATVAAIREHR